MIIEKIYLQKSHEVSKEDRLKRSEVETPRDFKLKMLNYIPDEFFKTPKRVLEPCVGKMGFVPELIEKFYTHLDIDLQGQERIDYIVKNCIFTNELNKDNIDILIELMKHITDVPLNYTCKDVLKEKLEGDYDLVVMNPPFIVSKITDRVYGNKSTNIYQHFILKAMNEWLNPEGLLLSIHPTSWRRPCTNKSLLHRLFPTLIKENQTLLIDIISYKEAKKIFKADIIVDITLTKKTKPYTTTTIYDVDGIEHSIDLSEYKWLPHGKFQEVFQYFHHEEVRERTKERREYGSSFTDEPTEENIYPVVCRFKNCKPVTRYCHHSNPALIVFSSRYITHRYFKGITHTSSAINTIKVRSEEEADACIQLLQSDIIKELMPYLTYSPKRVEIQVFLRLKHL